MLVRMLRWGLAFLFAAGAFYASERYLFGWKGQTSLVLASALFAVICTIWALILSGLRQRTNEKTETAHTKLTHCRRLAKHGR
jgi:lysylphosphatidylglycerol synthetase-like protein (DUF2156 family)